LLFDNNGKVVRAVGVTQDITDRKLAHKALTESQMSLAQAQRITHIGNWDWNIDQDSLFWSDEMFRIFGLDKDGFKASYDDFINVVHPDDKDFVNEQVQSSLEGRAPFDTEFRLLLKDGTLKNIEARGEVFRDENGKPIRMIGTNQDITERKQVEQALLESERLLKEAERMARVGSWQWDMISNEFIFSEQWQRNHGVTKSRLSMDNLMHIAHPDDIKAVNKAFQDVLNGVKPFYDIEHRIIRQDNGEVRFVRAIGEVTERSELGEPLKMFGFAQDITERKLAEIEREHLMVAMKAKNKELEHFSDTISHDFGNPVLSIQAFSIELAKTNEQLLQLLDEQNIEPKAKRQLLTILKDDVSPSIGFVQDAVGELRRLIEGLRQVASFGRTDINVEQVDINKLIKQITGAMKFQLQDCDVSLIVDQLPNCLGDANHIMQVFTNLLTNAIKYRASDKKGQIKIYGQVEDNNSIYCVEDNGIGISPENQKKVFDIFYRVDHSHLATGEGLGLAIVAKILDRLNGKIWVESEFGKGSRFYVALPHLKN